MAINTSNKLLPFLAFLVLLLVIGGIFMFKNTDLGNSAMDFFSVKTTKKKEVTVDGDNQLNTLTTIATDSAEIRESFKDVKEEQQIVTNRIKEQKEQMEALKKNNQLLLEKFELQSKKLEAMTENKSGKIFDLDKVKAEILSTIQSTLPKTPDYAITPSSATNAEIEVESENYSTQHSINIPVGKNGAINPLLLNKVDDKTIEKKETKTGDPIIDPRYTIFANSILYDSVAVTHLIGRIPRDGNVGDAAPFKVLIGAENLSANGFSVPGLKGMIMSGSVFGDSTLSCVRGDIYSATYIFEDGRGIVFPKNSKGGRRNKDNAIGWISDEFGSPCIPGKYISNKKSQLKNKILAQMAAGAASSFAESQVTVLTNDKGGTKRVMTGSAGKHALGTALSSGTNELVNYLQANDFDYWDAVVIPSGKRVAVHIDTTLELDNSSLLRKVIYEKNTSEFGLTD